MNHTKTIQYLILVIIGILLSYQFLPIGNYCVGIASFFKFLFLGLIFIITFVVIILINLNLKIKHKQKFDFIPSIIFIFFSATVFCLIQNDYEKFWTKTILTGKIEHNDIPKVGTLKLFENGTFEVRIRFVDFSCIYNGNYIIQEDLVKLEHENLENETENYFTTEYKIYSKENRMKPLKKEFEEIVIE